MDKKSFLNMSESRTVSKSLSADTAVVGTSLTSTIMMGPRYRWTSKIEYISNVLYYSIIVHGVVVIVTLSETDCRFIPYLIVTFFVGMPLQYMQVSIGQYTQLSGSYLKNMCPIVSGIGYLFILSTIFRIIPISVFAGDCILYLCSTLIGNLPWLDCIKLTSKDICWPSMQCNGTCLNSTVQTSAHIYWQNVFLGMDFDKNPFLPDSHRSVAAALIWIMIYIMLVQASNTSKKIIQYMFTISILLYLFIAVLIVIYTPDVLSVNLLEPIFSNLLTPRMWITVTRRIIICMGIPRGGHILLGSYLDTSAHSGIITLFSVLILVITWYLIGLLFILSTFVVLFNCKLTENEYSNLPYFFNGFLLTIVPYSFGFACLAQVMSITYFVASIFLSLAHVTINVKMIQIILEDDYPRMIRYRKYIRFTFLSVCLLFSVIFVTKAMVIYIDLYNLNDMFDGYDICMTFLLSLLISWVYGVQRLCDDIHFNTGSQPTKFWKICWYLLPAIVGLCYVWTMMETFGTKYGKYKLFFIHALFLPSLIVTVIKIFRYLTMRNVIQLFKPLESWGSPNLHERQMRQIFNPRLEVRSRRRNEACFHRCLLDSNVLQSIVDNERNFQAHFELSNNTNTMTM